MSGRRHYEDSQSVPSDTRSDDRSNPFSHWHRCRICLICAGIQGRTICKAFYRGGILQYDTPVSHSYAAMKVLYVLWLVLAGLFIGLISLIAFPLLLLYVGVKIIGGFASKLN